MAAPCARHVPMLRTLATNSFRSCRPSLFTPRPLQALLQQSSLRASFSSCGRLRAAHAPALTPANAFAFDSSRHTDTQHTASAKKSFPKTSHKSVAYWLLGSAASVFGIVVFGGLTRLTESGLSITEWKPVTGSRPPMNQADWDSEFAKYRTSPEFVRLNSRMTLDEFKQIYWMEWGHRLWGRVIGVTFLVPTIYFIATRRVASHMAWKISGICGLIGFQGMIGWWMVKSGLKEDLFAPGSHPRVSQYRLAAHLGTAFIAYSAMVATGLSILREHALLKDPKAALSLINKLASPPVRKFRLAATLVGALIFTTAMSGALVAGLDAGLIYNEFPWMGLGLTPPKAELLDANYSQRADRSDLLWRNMLENPSLVQLDHRALAVTTFTTILALFAYPRLSAPLRAAALPRAQHRALAAVLHMASLQVVLGISTLIYMVPTWLAAMHQAGALALLTTAVVLGSRLRVPVRTGRLVREAVARQQTAAAAAAAAAAASVGRVGGAARVAAMKPASGSIEQIVR